MSQHLTSMVAALIVLFALLYFRVDAEPATTNATLLSPEQFTNKVVAAVKLKLPEASLTVVEPLKLKFESKDIIGSPNLGNAYLAYKASPKSLENIIAGQVALIASAKTKFAKGKLSEIIPVIKGEKFMETASRQLADLRKQFKGTAQGGVVSAKISDGLYVLYVFDKPDSISFITDSDAQELKLSEPELRKLALSNLRRQLLPELKLRQEGSLYLLELDSNYEASIILLTDELTGNNNFTVRGDLVAYVLARDTVFITGSKEPEALARAAAIADTESELPYSISNDPYVLLNGMWSRFHPEAK